MNFKIISKGIDLFLFAPSSPYPVAAFRILFGLLMLQNAFFVAPDLYYWYGVNGIVLEKTMSAQDPFTAINILSFFPENDTWLTVVFAVYVLATITLALGFKSRLSSIIVWLGFVSLYHRNCFIINSGDTFLRAMAFWMIFAPAGAAWSLDHRARQKEHGFSYSELVPSWGLRCLQLQFCFVYYHAFAAKAPGWSWVYGVAVYLSSRLEALLKFPLFPSPENIFIAKTVTWMTLVIESALFTLIWIKELRYYILGLAICMHLTIDWTMNIPQFEWTMIAAMVVFVYPIDLERFSNFVNSKIPRKPVSAISET